MTKLGRYFARTVTLLALTIIASTAISGIARGTVRYDESFGTDGIQLAPASSAGGFSDVTEGPDGKLLATGLRSGARCMWQPTVVRFTSNGQLDQSYGTGGVASGSKICLGIGRKIVVDARGTTVLVSRIDEPFTPTHQGVFAYRLDSAGNPSKKWGGKKRPGRAFVGIMNFQDLVTTRRGRTLISGNGTRRSFGTIVRLDRRGRPDRTLTGDRRTRTRRSGVIKLGKKGGVPFKFYSLEALPSGKFLVAATIGERIAALRFKPSGALDKSFGVRGIARVPRGADGDNHTVFVDLKTDHHGRIVLAGSIRSQDSYGKRSLRTQVAKLTRNGRRLDRFGDHGVTQLPHGSVAEVAVQNDGSIVVCGPRRLVRLTRSGEIDQSFSSDGYLRPALDLSALTVDSAGRLVGAGHQYGFPEDHAGLVRFLPR